MTKPSAARVSVGIESYTRVTTGCIEEDMLIERVKTYDLLSMG